MAKRTRADMRDRVHAVVGAGLRLAREMWSQAEAAFGGFVVPAAYHPHVADIPDELINLNLHFVVTVFVAGCQEVPAPTFAAAAR